MEGKRKKDSAFAVTKQIGRRLSPRIQERLYNTHRQQAERSWPKPLEYEVYPRSPFSISSQWGESCSKPPDTRHTLRVKANGPRFFFFHPYIARVVSVLRDSPVTDTRQHIHDTESVISSLSFFLFFRSLRQQFFKRLSLSRCVSRLICLPYNCSSFTRQYTYRSFYQSRNIFRQDMHFLDRV